MDLSIKEQNYEKTQTHVVQGDDHCERRPCNDEIDQPLCCGRHGNVERAQSSGGYFRDINPAAWPPAKLKEENVEVNTDDRYVSERLYLVEQQSATLPRSADGQDSLQSSGQSKASHIFRPRIASQPFQH